MSTSPLQQNNDLQIREPFVRIHGGCSLQGAISIDGAKNSALALIPAACLAGEGWTVLSNVPDISDIATMRAILHEMGMESRFSGSELMIRKQPRFGKISKKNASKIRASILFLGAVVASLGEVELPLPGGDPIGDRPVDIHIESLEALGIRCEVNGGIIHAKANQLPLKGGEVFLRFPSVGVTENIMLAAALAEGTSFIENAASEPEIVDLAVMLNKMGARISGAGTNMIKIEGVPQLHGVSHEVIPDRLEAGTLLMALAISRGRGVIKNAIPHHFRSLIATLRKTGVKITIQKDGSITVFPSAEFQPLQVIAMPYPGFPTDMQPLVTVLATQCQGASVISDILFPERFFHVPELRKMGAEIEHVGNQARVIGPTNLAGTTVKGIDIRSFTALLCAGLVAKDTTHVYGVEHLQRGHGHLLEKLRQLGADVEMVED